MEEENKTQGGISGWWNNGMKESQRRIKEFKEKFWDLQEKKE